MPLSTLKRKLIGTPLRTAEAPHERLSKVAALAIFSSDALSSVAYATEEILLVLILAGSAALSKSWPLSLVIVVLPTLPRSLLRALYLRPFLGFLNTFTLAFIGVNI
mgnify:CR=1 FL=1